MKEKWGLIFWGAAAGILVGVGGLILAAKTSCGLCTHVTFAQMFFPYALIADPPLSHYALDAILAGLQWPFYGTVVGSALSLLSKRRALFVIGILVAAHTLGVAEANRRVNAHWEFKRISGGAGFDTAAI